MPPLNRVNVARSTNGRRAILLRAAAHMRLQPSRHTANGTAPHRSSEDVLRRRTAAIGRTRPGQFSRQPALCIGAGTHLGRRGDRASGHAAACSGRQPYAIVTTAAYEGWARVAALFHPAPPICPGIHRSAVVAADGTRRCLARKSAPTSWSRPARRSARVAASAPFVSIGKGVTIGADCRIGAHASLSHALLGARVYIYPGARIGQEGFSFAITETGLPQHSPARPGHHRG